MLDLTAQVLSRAKLIERELEKTFIPPTQHLLRQRQILEVASDSKPRPQ